MAETGVRITADSSSYQREMKKAVQTMKELSSQSSLAATKAKLFGSAQDQLREKIKGLEQQISQQTKIVELNGKQAKELTDHLKKWQDRQTELQKEIDETKQALKESADATGKNSEETQKLQQKLADLQKEEKKVGEQVGKCEDKIHKHATASNKAEQALVELQGELKKTNQELKDVAWEKWSAGADKVTKTLDNVGTKMTAVTTAIVGFGAAATKTTADFDYQMSAVQAIAGATGDEYDALRDKAIVLGASTSFSATEAGQAMEFMAQAGWTTEDMLVGVAGVMDTAAASGEDLATTASIVTEGLTAFNMTAADSEHFGDILVATGNKSNAAVAEMGETFKYAGAICGTLGITLEDASIATGLMANAGIKGSQAGTALRSGLTRLVKPTKQVQEAMEKYGFALQTNEDGSVNLMATMEHLRDVMGGLNQTEQAAAMAALFGTEALSGWSAIANASQDDFSGLTQEVYNCAGAAQTAAEVRMDNLTGQIEELKGTLETIAIQVGDVLMPTIKKVVEKLQEWATAFANMDDEQKKTIVTIAAVVAAIGPLLLIVSNVIKTVKAVVNVIRTIKKVVTAVQGVVSACKLVKTGMAGLKVAFAALTSPIGLVIAVIAAAVAALVYLWNTNEDFRNRVIKTWENIKDTAVELWGDTKEAIANAIEKAKATVTTVANNIKTTAANVWNNIKTTAGSIWNGIRRAISDAITGAKSAVDQGVNLIKNVATNAWNSIKSTTSSVWNTIKTALTSPISSASSTISSYVSSIKSAMSNAWSSVSSTASSMWNSIKNTIANAISGAYNSVRNTINSIKNLFNFSWSLPRIKTPHFYISGYTKVLGVSIPSIGVNWYKNGGIMMDPTMFGMAKGTVLAGGEAGPEAILPLEPFYTRLGGMIDKKFAEMAQRLSVVYVTVLTELDGEVIAKKTTPMVVDEIIDQFDRGR